MRQKTTLSSVDAVKMVASAKIEAARNNWNERIGKIAGGIYQEAREKIASRRLDAKKSASALLHGSNIGVGLHGQLHLFRVVLEIGMVLLLADLMVVGKKVFLCFL